MNAWWWSYLLGVVGVVGLWLAGSRRWQGWAVGVAAQVAWIAYAFATDQYGFLVSACAYGVVYGRNLAAWWRTSGAEADSRCTTLGHPGAHALHPDVVHRFGGYAACCHACGHKWETVEEAETALGRSLRTRAPRT